MIQDKVGKYFNQIELWGEKWWGMAIYLAIPIFFILFPFLLGQNFFAASDTINWAYPAVSFYKKAIVAGQSIFLNEYILSGTPSFITAVQGFFSPFHYLIFRFLPFILGYNLLIFIYLLLAAFFMSLLLKKFQINFWGRYLASLIYIFSYWHRVSDLSVISSLLFLPLIFLLIWELQKFKFWPILVGGLAIGLMWLTVHYNWSIIIIIFGFLFSLFLAWVNRDNSIILAAKYLLMVFIGCVIGLIQLWPLYTYLAFTARAGGISYSQASAGSLDVFDFFRLILPHFNAIIFAHSEELLYLGILPLAFLFFSFFLKNKLSKFFVFSLFLGIVISLKYSPIFWLLAHLPVLNSLRVPSRWMILTYFSASILIAFATNNLNRETLKYYKPLLFIYKWLTLILIGLALVFTSIFYFFNNQILFFIYKYFDANIYPKTTKLPLDHYHQIINGLLEKINGLFNLFNPDFALPLFFLICAYWLLKLYFTNEIELNLFIPLAVLFTILNFIIILFPYQPALSGQSYLKESEIATFLKTKPAGRIFSFMPGFSEYYKLSTLNPSPENVFAFKSEIFDPNLNIIAGLESIDGYDNLMPQRMAEMLALIGSDRSTAGDKLTDAKLSLDEKIKLFSQRRKILDFLSVRYVISAFELPSNSGLTKIFETKVRPYDISVFVYENQAARSMVYFASSARAADPKMKYNSTEISNLIENDSILYSCPSQLGDLSNSSSTLEVLNNTKSSFSVKTESVSPALLVYSMNFMPGWKAYVNGKKAELCKVNDLYLGLVVRPGDNLINFNYSYYNFFN